MIPLVCLGVMIMHFVLEVTESVLYGIQGSFERGGATWHETNAVITSIFRCTDGTSCYCFWYRRQSGCLSPIFMRNLGRYLRNPKPGSPQSFMEAKSKRLAIDELLSMPTTNP
jgi:hypothetical protein